MLTFLPGLLRPFQEGTLCLHPLEGAPGAFMSDASPVSRALLVLSVNQGISASFSLLLSYRQLCTTRFGSIKGPQQIQTICAMERISAPGERYIAGMMFTRAEKGHELSGNPLVTRWEKQIPWFFSRSLPLTGPVCTA